MWCDCQTVKVAKSAIHIMLPSLGFFSDSGGTKFGPWFFFSVNTLYAAKKEEIAMFHFAILAMLNNCK